jgi:hypothetical protein
MRGCNAGFVSLSALIAHAEAGRCPSGVTRRDIDQLVVRADRDGYITDRRRITGPDGQASYPFDNVRRNIATNRAWNGSSFECYLCHRLFRELKDLNLHLGSPAHTGSRIYHCPPGGCQATFTTLSALVRHIEDDKCGVKRFASVQRAIQSTVDKFAQIKAIGYTTRA